MKKILGMLMCAVMLLGLAACGGQSGEQVSLLINEVTYNADGTVKKSWVCDYNEDGTLSSRQLYDGEEKLSVSTDYVYNEQGQVDYKRESWANGATIDYVYTYDEQGRAVEIAQYRVVADEREIMDRRSYEHDEQGNVVKETYSNELGGTREVYEMTYNKDGNILTSQTTNGDGTSRYENEYDEQGYHVMTEYYDIYGNLTQKEICERDEAGRLLKQTYEYTGGTTEWYVYTYDEQGNLLRKDFYIDGEHEKVNEYTYDEQGRLLSEMFNGEKMWEYAYGEDGRKTKANYYADGGLYSECVYEYATVSVPTERLVLVREQQTEMLPQ